MNFCFFNKLWDFLFLTNDRFLSMDIIYDNNIFF